MTESAPLVRLAETEPHELAQRRARLIGWSAFAVGTAVRLLGMWFTAQMGASSLHFELGIGPASWLASDVLGTAVGLVGAIIVARRPSNVIGWLYVAGGLIDATTTWGFAQYAVTVATDPGTPTVLLAWAAGVVDYSVPFAFIACVLTLFPDGHVQRPAWRWVVALAVVGGILRFLEVGFGERAMVLVTGAANPYRLPDPIGELLRSSSAAGIGTYLVEGAFVLSAFALAARYRAATLDGQRQIRWILLAGLAGLVGAVPLAISQFLPDALPPGFDVLSVLFLSLTLTPIATLIAITRYRLYEIDRIVNRAFLYGALTAILAGLFTAGIGLAQRVFVSLTGQSSDAAIVLTTLVVATVYAPLRKWLEAVIDRRFKYEARMGAYAHELTALLSLTEPDLAAERLVREVVRELELVGAAVLGAEGRMTAAAGTWPAEPVTTLRIAGADGALRALALGPRRDGRSHDPSDLADVERVAALAARASDPATSTSPPRSR